MADEVQKKIVAEVVECETLIVRKAGVKPSVTIKVLDGIAGVWVEQNDGTRACVAIYAEAGRAPVVGLYGPADNGGCNFAVSAWQDGPVMQLIGPDNEVVQLDCQELSTLDRKPKSTPRL